MEYWIEVKGHPRYLVSTIGRVKCLNWKNTGKAKICKLSDDGHGYLCVGIDGVTKKVHRIVLESFIPNPEKKTCVDHINTVRNDNRVENLRWATHRENNNNPISIKHYSENNAKPMLGKFGAEHNRSKPIIQLTKDGVFVKKWENTWEVYRELGINQGNIVSCLKGRYNSAGGFKWVYAKNYTRTKKISEIKPLF